MAEKARVLGFNGGEADAQTLARYDLDIYPRLAEVAENVFLGLSGSMDLAPGTQYFHATPGNAYALLRPWVFSVTTAYMLELTANNMRFIASDGLILLTGAPATIADFTNESATPPVGGGAPPDGGSGDVFIPPIYSNPKFVEYGEGGTGGYWIYE